MITTRITNNTLLFLFVALAATNTPIKRVVSSFSLVRYHTHDYQQHHTAAAAALLPRVSLSRLKTFSDKQQGGSNDSGGGGVGFSNGDHCSSSSSMPTTTRKNIIRIYAGEDGQSHFERMPLAFEPFTDTEGAHGKATIIEDASGISFRTSQPGYSLDWHCAPRRQYVIQLRGQLELEIGDGTKLIAGPGDVILAEDLTGQGHKTRVIGDEERLYAIVPLHSHQSLSPPG